VHGQERAQHVTDVDQRLARATFVDDEPYRHHSRNQHGTNQHRDQTGRSQTCANGADQFPVAGSERLDHDKRQQQQQT